MKLTLREVAKEWQKPSHTAGGFQGFSTGEPTRLISVCAVCKREYLPDGSAIGPSLLPASNQSHGYCRVHAVEWLRGFLDERAANEVIKDCYR